jgi:hypothetical protein
VNCEYRHQFAGDVGRLHFSCPGEARFKAWRAGALPQLRMPHSARFALTGDFKTPAIPVPDEYFDGELRLELKTVSNSLVELGGGLSAKFSGVPLELPRRGQLETRSALWVRLPQFSRAVSALHRTPWAVPAPLNALEGEVRLSAEGFLGRTRSEFPIRIETRLAGAGQKLNLDGRGVFRLENWGTELDLHPRLDLDLELSDVILAIPKLELQRPPRLLPDTRIVRSAPRQRAGKANETSGFDYNLRFHTNPSGQPLRLLSNLAQGPVPMQIQLKLSSQEEASGEIAVQQFPLELFRRDAVLEHFRLKLTPTRPDPPIDGAVRITYADYVVRILIYGTQSEPGISLRSEPPVPEDELWSVLLFGQPTGALDSGQAESVGQARSAVADRAVGLASLYLLASTPIESLLYDPSTGAVQAKFRLGGGTSLDLGTDAKERQYLGLRKRIGGNWTLSSEYTRPLPSNPVASASAALSAFLEWSRRY